MSKLDVRAYSDKEYEKIKDYNERKGKKRRLKIFQAGENEASLKYVRNKLKKAEMVNIKAVSTTITSKDKGEVQASLKEFLNSVSESLHDYIVQLPLPEDVTMPKFYKRDIMQDVDGLSIENQSILYSSYFSRKDFDKVQIPATARGIAEYMVYLESRKINSNKFYDEKVLEGKSVLIINRSALVGRPLSRILEYLGMTVTLAHSKTPKEYLLKIMENTDYIVCGVGIPKFLEEKDVPKGVTFIDVSTNFVDGKMCGDLYLENGDTNKFDFTPVPFGVGQLTVMSLMKNVSRVGFLQSI